MERAGGARRNASCGPHTWRADRQANQCRFSKRVVDAARQHHDAGALDRNGVAFARADAITAPGGIGVAIANPGCGQETADAKAKPLAGSGHLAGANASASAGTGGFLRMIPR